jgi:hypothetical protein
MFLSGVEQRSGAAPVDRYNMKSRTPVFSPLSNYQMPTPVSAFYSERLAALFSTKLLKLVNSLTVMDLAIASIRF